MAAAAASPLPIQKSPRSRMLEFVLQEFQSGKTDLEIREAAVKRFRHDPEMIVGGIDWLAFWAISDSQAIQRRKAVRRVMSSGPVSVFSDMESYLGTKDGRLLSILDMNKAEIFDYVARRRPVVEGELRHLDCVEKIAEQLPTDKTTPRGYYKRHKRALHQIINSYYEEE